MKNLLFIILGIPFLGITQNVTGYILDENNAPLEGASIHSLEEPSIGVMTNQKGYFELLVGSKTTQMIFDYIGYQSDTLSLKSYFFLNLKPTSQKSVVITELTAGAFQSKASVGQVEIISAKEFSKAACCDLAGCFGTQGSVRVETNNVLTNTKSLSLLGLRSTYNQVLIDGMPLFNGLSNIYGINTIPSAVIKKIFISKGTASGIQGYEGIAGQINVITNDYDSVNKVYVNTYVNSFLESQFNVLSNYSLGKFTKGIFGLHTTQMHNNMDRDDDGFLDMPKTERYSFSNKLIFDYNAKKQHQSTFYISGIKENKLGGMSSYRSIKDTIKSNTYGVAVDYSELKSYFKHAYLISEKILLKTQLSGFYHKQESWFGLLNYKALQTNIYGNIEMDYKYNKDNKFTVALSHRFSNIEEKIRFNNSDTIRKYNGQYLNNWNVTGLLLENNNVFLEDKLVLLTSLRIDYYNRVRYTPRFLLRYIPNEQHTLRYSIGTGWRIPTVFSDYQSVLGGNRNVVFSENPDVEQAINTGISYGYEWDIGVNHFSLNGDYYHTYFKNQYVGDYLSSSSQVLFYNQKNASFTDVAQLDFNAILNKRIEFKLNYNYTNAIITINGTKENQVFIPKHRLLGSLSYHLEHWQFDFQGHWNGRQHLPNTSSNPLKYQRGNYSPGYFNANTQVTYKVKVLELYLGCENITNFRQIRPIVAWQEPFSTYFDTYSTWASNKGIEFYFGLRWFIK